MRLPEMFSALTLNIALALFSMVMAIVALTLLAFVLAKETQTERNTIPRYSPREKIKRHESTTVDFRNPSTFPDHFLQLNTLMFQKRPAKNNQVTSMTPITLEGMERMTRPRDEDQIASRALPPLPNEISTNAVGRHRRAELEPRIIPTYMTPTPEEDFSDTASTRSTDAPSSLGDNSTSSSDWIVEKNTVEPLAEKRIVDLECGGGYSLC